MKNTHRNVAVALSIFCFGFFLYAEFAVYQHYLVINRDFFPIMSDFYKMYAERLMSLVGQLAGLHLGYRVATTTALQEIAA